MFAGLVASIITIPATYKRRASCHTPLSWTMQSGTLVRSILLRNLYPNNFVINHKTSVQFTASITSIWTNSLHKMDIDDYLPIRYLDKCYCRCRCFVILKPGLLSKIYFTIHVYWLYINCIITALDKMAAISQTTFSNAFLWMKSLAFLVEYHWSLSPRVQLTTRQHWLR